MKQLLDKMKGIRGLGWLLALGVGAALCLLWPGASSGGALGRRLAENAHKSQRWENSSSPRRASMLR